jgi:hypothetical protein
MVRPAGASNASYKPHTRRPIGLNSGPQAHTQAHRPILRPTGPYSSLLKFPTPTFEKRTGDPLGKSSIFFISLFSPELDRQPAFKLERHPDMLLSYRLIPRTHNLVG